MSVTVQSHMRKGLHFCKEENIKVAVVGCWLHVCWKHKLCIVVQCMGSSLLCRACSDAYVNMQM